MGYTYGRQYKTFQPFGAWGHYYCERRGQNFKRCLFYLQLVWLYVWYINQTMHHCCYWHLCVQYIRNLDKIYSALLASEILKGRYILILVKNESYLSIQSKSQFSDWIFWRNVVKYIWINMICGTQCRINRLTTTTNLDNDLKFVDEWGIFLVHGISSFVTSDWFFIQAFTHLLSSIIRNFLYVIYPFLIVLIHFIACCLCILHSYLIIP
jgi:hypothetical protein